MTTGLDRFLSDRSLAKYISARVGLLAHPASVTADLVHVATALRSRGIHPEIIFGPEHGYGGEAQDMIGVGDARDIEGTPVRSLYGERFEDLSPSLDDLARIDVLVIDLQDIGSRYYTFIWTAVLALRACAKAGVRVVVFDRPNPIGDDPKKIEGRCLLPRYRSFVGLEPIPIRHGMTLGEVCAFRREEEKLDVDLVVIGSQIQPDSSLWVLPSPNMPTRETALVYPGGCLLEGTNLSDGRGTTRPFEITGAPFIDGTRLARELNALALPGCIVRPLTFLPTFHKHAKKVCGGVQVHVTNSDLFQPVYTYVALIAVAQRQAPNDFVFRTERYEFVDDIPAFDLLTGDSETRERILASDDPRTIALDLSTLRPGEDQIQTRARAANSRVAV